MKRVVIVGGGFAGLSCARKLAMNADVQITLIDKNNYHQFQPLLYQVATAILASEKCGVPAALSSQRAPKRKCTNG